jgi:hypothetical protein
MEYDALQASISMVPLQPCHHPRSAGYGDPTAADLAQSFLHGQPCRRRCSQLACGSLPEYGQLALEEIKVAQEDLAKHESTIKPLERYRGGVAAVLDEVKMMEVDILGSLSDADIGTEDPEALATSRGAPSFFSLV